MIPRADIVAWRSIAPWATDAQVEQDLIISRVLVEIFTSDLLKKMTAFRGGTALHKLHLAPASRYSEDIDLVQINSGPIGPILDEIQSILNPMLGKPSRDKKKGNIVLRYRIQSEIPPITPIRLKIEINSREHFFVFPLEYHLFSVNSRWFRGKCEIPTYCLEELLGTKLRALYQRSKGRDLFDLWLSITRGKCELKKAVRCFKAYLGSPGRNLTSKMFGDNLFAKMQNKNFTDEINGLLRPDINYDAYEAYNLVSKRLLPLV